MLDIPDALGLLAPRKLTIIGGRDIAFDRTEEIYRGRGRRTSSLASEKRT